MIERFASGGPWEERYGYSRVVRAGDLLVTAGCTATVNGSVSALGDPSEQARIAFRIGLDALAGAGAAPADVIRTRMYVTDRSYAGAVTAVHGEIFRDVRPVTALIVVAGLLHEDHLVEVELDAYVGGKERA
ncbi:Rid family hydrolase [Couchioplanes caeruleus]|uniref:Enamine deaminase RidA (YjgF/YER057c/UK114 family) n=2 Tax=Couchioplanes caeruleus TaxID=56438 RepID=A0A1K0GV44_9ACTN|nr:Rid family hydrolase [Couchioplanes caeruleus]OJF13275.1 hypothetical protein BG844_16150 [Couchioplanes caeruleus subsp. caeruleus]ROP29180.1 enamine deaminase RidA (YjgF/YER057c/UK114 family) [Couchioplanes caeruleus]